jgi:hypothetical protein
LTLTPPLSAEKKEGTNKKKSFTGTKELDEKDITTTKKVCTLFLRSGKEGISKTPTDRFLSAKKRGTPAQRKKVRKREKKKKNIYIYSNFIYIQQEKYSTPDPFSG